MEKAIEQLKKLIQDQARSTDIWIVQWEKHKDEPSARNAAFAIGKLVGVINALMYLDEGCLPEDLIDLREKYTRIWEQL